MVSASDGLPLPDRCGPIATRSASFNGALYSSSSPTSRSRQSSPVHSPRVGPSHLSSSRRSRSQLPWYRRKRLKVVVALVALLGSLFLVNWIMLASLQHDAPNPPVSKASAQLSIRSAVSLSVSGKGNKSGKGKKPQKGYQRMLALAAHALAEDKREPKDLWQEPLAPASTWRPCSDLRIWEPNEGKNGYILVTANGGINQQRVAVCNAVVVARLLNSTLVIPKFMYSSVWRDVSQFGDIYQEEHFIKYLTPDIRIVHELPKELQSLDLEAIGSVVTDVDMVKEAKPSFYLKNILPIILKNQVVHFVGFGNRLAFDPIPFELQRLRCRCNFHALQFVPRIQETGALLLKRLRKHEGLIGPLDRYLLGPFAESVEESGNNAKKASKYLALHLRFEIDMVSHSLCEFGGGEEERKELDAYREIHFPALAQLKRTTKLPSPSELRAEGLCPLTPEEAVLMLAGLGFNRKTHVFVAGSNLYGGRSRLVALTSLYPKLVTKENLLSAAELEPFANYSSQLAALDFIGCTASDAFAMTDSGSQLSSLVSGYRIYYGGGRMPTIRPNKRRLASIFMKNSTIEWRVFEQRVRKAIRQTKHVQTRPKARSVYRYPRCKECMCRTD
ncbi:O-fucosyltransferase 15 [Stylosanthes scabra]|uniref:O-fucosyltransferase family protein n=1 Tax=Stylosanthes scabra TaxID=79078 RepID=A0ABU6YGS4_9FABA|nr:O-fucosyltransferase 15 [Stylosanthes scabra]